MTPLALLTLAAAASLLALFQWMELLVVRAGGEAVCAIGATVDCEAVWNSPLASWLHDTAGLPVAGLGLVWGVTAFALSLWLARARIAGEDGSPAVGAVRVAAAAGVVACIVFAAEAIRVGSLCLTCLGTYLVVCAYAAVAFFALPRPLVPRRPALARALGWPAAVGLAAFLLALYPGLKTPHAASAGLGGETKGELQAFLDGLSPLARRSVASALAEFRRAPPPDGTPFRTRHLLGPDDAPVRIVDFTDIRCPHCRQLDDTLKEIRRALPNGLAVEPRYFPLGAECNPYMGGSDGTGVRCIGALAQVCLEGAPDFEELRGRLFAEQESLTAERIFQIASSGSVGRAALEACISGADARRKLAEDIEYAWRYRPRGTPLVIVNGRQAAPLGPLLYALVLARGDPDAPAFRTLTGRDVP